MAGRAPIEVPISLTLTVQAGGTRFDLDHLVSAVANGLAYAPRSARLSDVWSQAEPEIHPSIVLCYLDDRQVRHINAVLLPPEGKPSEWWYEVTIAALE